MIRDSEASTADSLILIPDPDSYGDTLHTSTQTSPFRSSATQPFSGNSADESLATSGGQAMEQRRQKRHVAREEHVAVFGEERGRDRFRVVVRTQARDHRELGKRVQRAETRLRGLARAELPAVPDHRRPGATFGGGLRDTVGLLLATARERPHVVDVRGNGVGVMDEKNELCH